MSLVFTFIPYIILNFFQPPLVIYIMEIYGGISKIIHNLLYENGIEAFLMIPGIIAIRFPVCNKLLFLKYGGDF
jgi:hypothetical protein